MKKVLILALVLISLILGVSYFFTGKFIEQNYTEAIAKFNEQSNTKVSLIDYKRGVLHSTAKLGLTLPANSNSLAVIIPVQQTITHGPLIAVNTLHGYRLKILASQIQTTLQAFGQPPLTLNTMVNFSDQATTWFRINLDSTKNTTKNATKNAISGEVTHDLNFIKYNGYIKAPKLTLNSPHVELSATDLVLTIQADNEEPNYLNNNQLNIKTISFTKANAQLLKLEDISVKLALDKNAEKNIDINVLANIASSQIAQQQFPANSIKLQISNINPSNLVNLPIYTSLNPITILDLTQRLTSTANTTLALELPKPFTEVFLSYVSYELYKSSVLGKVDKRSDDLILKDITGRINNIINNALKKKLFVDQGSYYALNFDHKTGKPS